MEVTIKAGSSAQMLVQPKINGEPIEITTERVGIYLVSYNKIDKAWEFTGKAPYLISLTPQDTLALLGEKESKHKYKVQFSITTDTNKVFAEDINTDVTINIIRWEAAQWQK